MSIGTQANRRTEASGAFVVETSRLRKRFGDRVAVHLGGDRSRAGQQPLAGHGGGADPDRAGRVHRGSRQSGEQAHVIHPSGAR